MIRPVMPMLLTIFVAVACQPGYAADRYGPAVGGPGGVQFRLRCPPGAVVTGVVGHAGAYVDAIGPACSGTGSSPGYAGTPRSPNKDAFCPSGSRISRFAVQTLRSDNHLLNALRIECVEQAASGHVTATLPYYTPSEGDHSDALEFWLDALNPNEVLTHKDLASVGLLTCAPDAIVGFQGNAGASIDAFGLICGR